MYNVRLSEILPHFGIQSLWNKFGFGSGYGYGELVVFDNSVASKRPRWHRKMIPFMDDKYLVFDILCPNIILNIISMMPFNCYLKLHMLLGKRYSWCK